MTGKRILDIASLAQAARNVAQKHIQLRSQQVDSYGKTSSVAKAVLSQTSRVNTSATVASSVLFDQLKDKSKSVSTPSSTLKPSTTDSTWTGLNTPEGLAQDHHYEKSPANESQDEAPEEDLPVRQEQAARLPLADGTIPPEGAEIRESPDQATLSSRPVTETPKEPLSQESPPDAEIEPASSGRSSIPDPETLGPTADQSKVEYQGAEPKGQSPQKIDNTSLPGIEGTAALTEEVTGQTPDLHPAGTTNDASASATPFKLHESRVPSTQLGRLWQYGGLATSMAFGAVGESFRRVTGGESEGSLVLSAKNMDRLVSKLSRMRGAALKLGQMMSFQDSKLLPEPIAQVLARVQDSADYMPSWQRDQVLTQNLGTDWRDLFSDFMDVPMAAASIGQVHEATLREDGQRVAVKIQYPGVANSIDSDLNNLSLLLTASRLLPKGLYLDKTIENARTELGWECDYNREAEAGRKFRTLLADDTDTFTVPKIIDAASGPQVLTMEYMSGRPVAKHPERLTQSQRDWISTQILRLCLREITEFHYMQTDPNWTNFLFNDSNAGNKIELLDFGASRAYPPHFIEPYVKVLAAAARGDRQAVQDLSVELGYLTGAESKAMTQAHVESVLILAEPFTASAAPLSTNKNSGVYSFQGQDVTDRVRSLIPVMIRERLKPPPEETYSLHRKLSGAFLLCARLGARVDCRGLFVDAMGKAGVQV